MSQFGGSLSSSAEMLLGNPSTNPAYFDVAVVGSGYGASITAARLAQSLRPHAKLCVLERGKEWIPGTFPDTIGGVLKESRLKMFGRNVREVNNPTGLFNLLSCDEIRIFTGSGLGGTSLINASVAYRPDAEVFLQTQWPNALRDRRCLDPYFDRAAWELHARVDPLDWTCKLAAQRLAAERLRDYQCHFEAAAITVTRSFRGPLLPVLNRQGMFQRDCNDCGDCMTGCNVGAKNTLAMNYLPLARKAGATIFSRTEVRCIEKLESHYRVHFLVHSVDSLGNSISTPGCLVTRILVLGAGSIGSSEILMRSQCDGFQLSRMIGKNWTGNGDALGFVLKSDFTTNSAGKGSEEAPAVKIGPTIQSNIAYPYRPNLHDRVLIQEGAVAKAYARSLSLLMRDFELNHTLPIFGMGHDGQQGVISLDDNGNGFVKWPGLTDSDYRKLIRLEFGRIAHAHGGKYRTIELFGDQMVTVHPLGGCGMSDDPRSGVINHKGQVFDCDCGGDIDPNTGEFRIHENLYVSDGAIFPTAIACNPHLTIAAMAERNAQLMTLEPKYADIFKG